MWSSTAVEHLTLTLGVLDWSEGLLLAGLNCPASVCKAVGLNNRTCACVLFVTSEAAAICCCSAYVSTVLLFLALGRQLLTLTGFALFCHMTCMYSVHLQLGSSTRCACVFVFIRHSCACCCWPDIQLVIWLASWLAGWLADMRHVTCDK